MSSPSFRSIGPSEKGSLIRIGVASGLWLIAAAVAGHFLWQGVPWIVAMLLAAMAELLALTVWLIGSTFNDPVKRWDLPPNPADAHKGWRGALVRVRGGTQAVSAGWVRKVLRRPAKV